MCSKPFRFRSLRPHNQRGAVTIEFAIVLTGIVALLAAILVLLTASITGLHCVEAAHTGARMAAIGEPPAQIEKLARDLVGQDASITTRHEGAWVTVTVTAPVRASWGKWEVSHTAHAYLEPGL